MHGMLAGRVPGAPQQRRQAGDAFIGDDQPATLDQAVYRRLGAVQGTEKIDCHDALVDFDARLHKGAALGDAGIVEEHIDAAESFDNRLHGRFAIGTPGHVTPQPQGPVSGIGKFLFTGVQARRVHIQQGAGRTGPGKSAGHRQPDPAGGAGHHNDSIGKTTSGHARLLYDKNAALVTQCPPRNEGFWSISRPAKKFTAGI
jgi:hypothetical protein